MPGLMAMALASAAADTGLSAERIARLREAAAKAGVEAAVTPLRVAAPDPAILGKLLVSRNPINPPAIASQKLEALGAVQATFGTATRVLPLSVVAPVSGSATVPGEPARLAWCDGKQDKGNRIRCFQDNDGDGRFETARWGQVTTDSNPLTLYALGPREPIAPVPYTRVDAAALPDYRLIYQGCRVTDRIQYAVRIGVAGDGDVKVLGCPDAAVPVGHERLTGPGRYRIDRVVVDIAADNGTEASVTLVAGLPAGTLLDRIDPGRPLMLLGERETYPVEQARLQARFERPAYRFDEVPTLTGTGGAGDPIVEGRYRYGYTARVRGDVTRKVMFSGRKPAFDDGEALYGLPMTNPLAPQLFGESIMMWCAPKQDKPGRWRATCVQQEGVSRGVYRSAVGGLWVEQIPIGTEDSDPVDIVEDAAGSDAAKAAGLPTPRIRYAFEKWTKNRLFVLASAAVGDAREPARRIELPRFEDGSALLGIGGGVVKLTETAGGGFAAALVRPFEPDRNAQVKSGLLLWVLDQGRPGGRPMSEQARIDHLDD